MSSEAVDLTVAPRKRVNPAQYWAFFTPEDDAFWHGVDGRRADLKTLASAPQHAAQAHQHLSRRTYWWWRSLVGLLMLAGALGGCNGDDHEEDHHARGRCVLVGEREPNDTTLIAQILDPGVAGDCASVEGQLLAATDVDTYAIVIEETLTLLVTVDHSPGVDLDVQLFNADTGELILDCGSPGVPEVCVVPFVVRARDLAVDVVVTSVVGAGPYTLTLDVQ
jgi:hypothetical protein